jgi:NADH:ubiquinone oxidoreductase subunit 4 (subunit M)
VFFGEVTHEKNRELKDTSARENWMLAILAVVILWMGVSSPFFTRRFAAPCKTVLEEMNPNVMHEAAVPGVVVPQRGAMENSAETRAAR